MPKTCVVCGNEFEPYRDRNRCCSRECSAAYFADERRDAVARFRAERASTYHAHAMADAAAELGGRFASTGHPHVIGAAPVAAPLAAPSWSRDLAALPDEPSLGYRIDELPPEGQ